MPYLDGLEVCRRLRADPRLRAVPILLVTALEDGASRLAGIEAGADDFLPKPFDRVELLARVRAMLRFNHYRQLHEEHVRLETERQQAENALRQSKARLRGLFEQLPVGVTLLDLRMPGDGGLPVLTHLKALTPDRIAIILTSFPYPQYREACLASGADYFFDKTQDIPKLTEVLVELVSKTRRLTE